MVVGGWGWGTREKLVKGYTLSAIRRIKSEELMLNMVTTVNNTVFNNNNNKD